MHYFRQPCLQRSVFILIRHSSSTNPQKASQVGKYGYHEKDGLTKRNPHEAKNKKTAKMSVHLYEGGEKEQALVLKRLMGKLKDSKTPSRKEVCTKDENFLSNKCNRIDHL